MSDGDIPQQIMAVVSGDEGGYDDSPLSKLVEGRWPVEAVK